MPRPRPILFGIAVYITLFSSLLAGCKSSDTKGTPDSSGSTARRDTLAQSETAAPKHVDSLTISLSGREEWTVLALLEESHAVKKTGTAMGTFVNGIDSIMNNSETFWMYSVNDSMGQVASDKYITHAGDRVVWHFRRFLK